MANAEPQWPCIYCHAHSARAVDMFAEILQLAATSGPPLPVVCFLVSKCLKHSDTAGFGTKEEHCDAVALALTEAKAGNWALCIDALDHP
ncbi:MAG: hypothetical protein ACYSX0_03245 [Planctomycetota bacterium]|jgi:ribosomal protein S12 methylthiotransferase accessory factor YcaO